VPLGVSRTALRTPDAVPDTSFVRTRHRYHVLLAARRHQWALTMLRERVVRKRRIADKT